MACTLVWMVVLLGCTGTPPLEPAERAESAAQVSASLHQAVYLHGNGRSDEAVEVWHDAHATLRQDLLDAVREARGDREALRVEYLMGRVRHQLELPTGEPDPLVSEVESVVGEVLEAAEHPAP